MGKKRPPKRPRTTLVNPKDIIVPTRLLHESLTPEQAALSRWTYKHAGKYLYGNYEQWENGFLREPRPDDELIIWMRWAAILKHLKPETTEYAKKLIGSMISGDPLPEARKVWGEIESQSKTYVEEAFREAEESHGSQ